MIEALLGILAKVLEHFLELNFQDGDPKKALCQNLTRFYLLVEEFRTILEELLVLLEIELFPLLDFRVDELFICDENSFSRRDVRTLKSHLSNCDETLIQQIVDNFNRLNQVRDGIFDLITRLIPLEKLGILYPEFEREVWNVTFFNIASPLKVGFLTEVEKVSLAKQLLPEGGFSFHSRFLSSLNSQDDGEWRDYLKELKRGNGQIIGVKVTLQNFIQTHCTLSDII